MQRREEERKGKERRRGRKGKIFYSFSLLETYQNRRRKEHLHNRKGLWLEGQNERNGHHVQYVHEEVNAIHGLEEVVPPGEVPTVFNVR